MSPTTSLSGLLPGNYATEGSLALESIGAGIDTTLDSVFNMKAIQDTLTLSDEPSKVVRIDHEIKNIKEEVHLTYLIQEKGNLTLTILCRRLRKRSVTLLRVLLLPTAQRHVLSLFLRL